MPFKAGPLDLPVLNVGKADEVKVYVVATLENSEEITITGKPYTEYDRAVHDAIVSLYEDRKKHGQPTAATADMIYRTMTHKTDTEKVSPQQREAVTKSIDKMRKNIYVYADVSAEMQHRGIVSNADAKTKHDRHKLVLDNYLLSAKHFDNMGINGSNVSGYIFDEPLLLSYSKLTGQIITVKGEILDIREIDKNGNITDVSIMNSDSRIAIKSYLLRRVEVMRSDEKRATDALRKHNANRKKNNTLPLKKIGDFRKQARAILFSSLFEATGITNKNTKTNSREYVTQVLDYWKALHNIGDYTLRKKGKSFDAIVIKF